MSKDQLFKKAHAKHMQGNYDGAVKHYKELLRISPDHLDANYLLGTLYAQTNALSDAKVYLEKADSINPSSPYIKVNLGNICKMQGDFESARTFFVKALELNPDLPQAHFGLGTVLEIIDSDFDAALQSYQAALELNPNDPELLQSVGKSMAKVGLDAGLKCLNRAFNLNPRLPHIHRDCGIANLQGGNPVEAAGFLRTALLSDQDDPHLNYLLCVSEGRLPDELTQVNYVREEFNKFANDFEPVLVDKLEYNIPQNLIQFMSENLPKGFRFRTALDLGCGTGLFGNELRNHVDRLEGIDLSAKMLDLARNGNRYDQLYEGEIVATLGSIDQTFELFSATDVLIYVGNLDPLFEAIKEKSNMDATFVFSTESCDGDGFVLQNSGRYAHSVTYINAVAAKCGCRVIATKRAPIRKEGTHWIMGDLYIVRYQS